MKYSNGSILPTNVNGTELSKQICTKSLVETTNKIFTDENVSDERLNEEISESLPMYRNGRDLIEQTHSKTLVETTNKIFTDENLSDERLNVDISESLPMYRIETELSKQWCSKTLPENTNGNKNANKEISKSELIYVNTGQSEDKPCSRSSFETTHHETLDSKNNIVKRTTTDIILYVNGKKTNDSKSLPKTTNTNNRVESKDVNVNRETSENIIMYLGGKRRKDQPRSKSLPEIQSYHYDSTKEGYIERNVDMYPEDQFKYKTCSKSLAEITSNSKQQRTEIMIIFHNERDEKVPNFRKLGTSENNELKEKTLIEDDLQTQHTQISEPLHEIMNIDTNREELKKKHSSEKQSENIYAYRNDENISVYRNDENSHNTTRNSSLSEITSLNNVPKTSLKWVGSCYDANKTVVINTNNFKCNVSQKHINNCNTIEGQERNDMETNLKDTNINDTHGNETSKRKHKQLDEEEEIINMTQTPHDNKQTTNQQTRTTTTKSPVYFFEINSVTELDVYLPIPTFTTLNVSLVEEQTRIVEYSFDERVVEVPICGKHTEDEPYVNIHIPEEKPRSNKYSMKRKL